jgi:uncharacterized membrane protein
MNWVHLHLALNHVPIFAVVFGFGILALALVKRSQELKQLSLIIFVLAALATVPVYLTGDPSEDSVEAFPGVSTPIIEQHEEAAAISFASIAALGVLSVIGLIAFRKGKTFPQWAALSALAFSLAVSAVMLRTANLGGQIRHVEIRSGVPLETQHVSENHD